MTRLALAVDAAGVDWRILRVEDDEAPFLVLCKAPGADEVAVLEFATADGLRECLMLNLGSDPARGRLLAQLRGADPDFGGSQAA